jgi:hypothetical protein
MKDLTNSAQLTTVLSMLSANDTATVKKGEKALKPFLKQPASTQHLLSQIQNATDASVRHHAALLLKKKLHVFYTKYTAAQQGELRLHLLHLMVSEPNKGVRTAIAGAVSTLAKGVFTAKQEWPELFQSLMQMSQDPNEGLRALNYSLLSQLAETVATQLKPHVGTLAQMFVMGCQDALDDVKEAALSATSSLIKELGSTPEVMALQTVINPMLAVMSACLQNGSEDTVIEGLDVIQEACLLEQPLVNDHLEVIVQFTLSVLQGEGYDSGVMQSAGQTLINIIEFRPKLMAKKNLVAPVLATLMQMVAKQDSSAAGALFSFSAHDGILEDEKDDPDEEEMDVQRLAQSTIDCMAINVPSKYFVEPALALCSQGMASTDPQMRKAGCAVLGVIAEGCADRIRESLGSILPRLLELVADPEYYVRECACFALGQFSEHCQPDILYHNQTVLPVIFQALDDPRPTVQGTSCYTLEYFCESLKPETLRPYLTPLMTRLANLLQSPQKTTQEMALSAIAATAVAAEMDFLPFCETICGILGGMIFNTEAAMFAIRGRALECLGHIAVAIGGEHFARYFEQGMQSATQGVHLNDEALKEHSFVFIANCAKAMGKAYQSYLPSLVPFLLEVVSENELVFVKNDSEDEEEEQEEGEEEEEGGDYRVHVEEGFVNAKKAALTALGALAEHTHELYAPYLKATMDALLGPEVGSIHSIHEVIRAEALSIMQYMVAVALAATGRTAEPALGEVLQLDAFTAEIASGAMNQYTQCLLTDEDKLPVSYATEGLCGVLRNVGLAALQLPGEDNTPVANHLMKAIHLILSEKSPCQVQYEGDAKEEDDEDDHDNLVMDAITDLVGALAKVLGPNFVPYFDEFQKQLLRFTKPTRAHTDRSMAIGCYAEVIGEIGPAALKYVDLLLPMIQAGLADPMEGVRRNAAFCVATLVSSTDTALAPHFLSLLQWLHPLCVRHDTKKTTDVGGADVDNALAAVAKMILAAPAAVPLPQVLPVLLAALPLREDTDEGPCVYKCLAQLMLSDEPTAVGLAPQLIAAFGETLCNASASLPDTKDVSRQFFAQAAASPQYGPIVAAYLAQVSDPEDRQLIQNAASGSS